MTKQIIPSVITDNINEVRTKLETVAGASEWVHIDIMDGEFVDEVSIELHELKDIETKLNIDLHLMVTNPLKYLDECKELGVKRVIYHFEAVKEHLEIIEKLNQLGIEKGIALNPETPVKDLENIINRFNLVLLLAVNPGRGGQKFIESTLKKIRDLKRMSPEKAVAVDGGVNENNIAKISRAGADIFVVGSAVFFYKDARVAVQNLKSKANTKQH